MLRFFCIPYGRISRFSYIVKFMFPLNMALVFGRLSDALRTMNEGGEFTLMGSLFGPFVTGVLIVFAWPIIAVSTRRLHDIGHSGWWLLMPLFFLSILFFDDRILFDTEAHFRELLMSDAKYTLFAAVIPVGMFLGYLNSAPGEDSDNYYGEDPLRNDLAETEFLRQRRLSEQEQLAE